MGAIAGAAIGAAGDLAATGISTAASIANTNSTNKANKEIAESTNQANIQIAQMSNEFNREQLERQIQQEWDMWNAENEYNSASSQRQRLEEAGLNPYMMMDGGSAGSASSMTSPTPQPAVVPQMQGATMQKADLSALSGLRGIASEFIASLKAQEEIRGQQLINEGQEIENQYKADKLLADLEKTRSESGFVRSQTTSQDIMNRFKPEMLSSELRQRNVDTMFTQLRSHGQMIANLSSYQWYKALPQQIKQTINEQMVRINNMKLQGNLTQAQINTEINKAVTEFMKGAKEQLQFNFENESYQDRLDQIKYDLRDAINNSGPQGGFGLFNILQNQFDYNYGSGIGSRK